MYGPGEGKKRAERMLKKLKSSNRQANETEEQKLRTAGNRFPKNNLFVPPKFQTTGRKQVSGTKPTTLKKKRKETQGSFKPRPLF